MMGITWTAEVHSTKLWSHIVCFMYNFSFPFLLIGVDLWSYILINVLDASKHFLWSLNEGKLCPHMGAFCILFSRIYVLTCIINSDTWDLFIFFFFFFFYTFMLVSEASTGNVFVWSMGNDCIQGVQKNIYIHQSINQTIDQSINLVSNQSIHLTNQPTN